MEHISYDNGYYDGDVNNNNERHGYGTFVWKNGDKYVGEWRNDEMNGRGRYTWNDGGYYEGDFKDNKFNGWGTVEEIGCQYTGEWRDDKKMATVRLKVPMVILTADILKMTICTETERIDGIMERITKANLKTTNLMVTAL